MKDTAKIGLGTVQFGQSYGISNISGITSQEEVATILEVARSSGILILDTAYAYGIAETVLGKVGVRDFQVVTKFNATSLHGCSQQIERSLSRLQVLSVYGILAHNPSHLEVNQGLWDVMMKLKHVGKVKKIGFSFNRLSEIDIMINRGFIPDIVQIPYNIVDERFKDIAIYYRSRGCEIHSRSAYLQGLFFCNPTQLSDFFSPIKGFIAQVQRKSSNVAATLLQYVLRQEFIDKVIIGVNTAEQLARTINDLDTAVPLFNDIPELPEELLAPSEWKTL